MTKVNFHYWNTLVELKERLSSKGVVICGVEICDGARDFATVNWDRPVAFMLGNEGSGLSEKQKAVCDFFVYIPHYSGATASLNVAVAGGIIFHNFARKIDARLLCVRPETGFSHRYAGLDRTD